MDISTVGELIEALKAYPSDYPLEVETGSDFGLQIVSIELARWKLLSGGKETEYRYLTDKGKAEDEGSEQQQRSEAHGSTSRHQGPRS